MGSANSLHGCLVLSYPILLVLMLPTHRGMEGWVNPQPDWVRSQWVLNQEPLAWRSTVLPTKLSWPYMHIDVKILGFSQELILDYFKGAFATKIECILYNINYVHMARKVEYSSMQLGKIESDQTYIFREREKCFHGNIIGIRDKSRNYSQQNDGYNNTYHTPRYICECCCQNYHDCWEYNR